jgi:DNA-binding CsgD family transcriptional regulator
MNLVTGLQDIMNGSETADEAAIKEVCFNETWGSHFGEVDLWASTWLQREDCSLIGIFWGTGLFARAGWAEIDAALRPYVEATAACGSGFLAFRHAGHRIKVIGDMACATFTETNWHISDVDRKNPMDLLEHRVLERHNGQWKIAHLIFVPVRSVAHDRAHIRVDASGRVAHISPAMRAALAGSGLTISAGRLRADRPKWDRELQAAICRTHGLTGFGEMGAAFTEGEFLDRANTREFPILLGEDDGGGQRYCIVMVQDGEVFVALDDPARIDRRLRLANVVYGLSAAQLRLAREIVGGLALPAAAEKLGISPNTARTHLNRIFEKTGVSNQAALVRCLLTVGA